MTGQTPPPGPGHPTTGPVAGTRPGELLDRFLARLVDGILLAVVNGIVVSAIVVGAILGDSGGFYYGADDYAAAAVSAILSAALYLAYFGVLESSRGQTVGKMVMKLHVLGPQGGNPTLEQALRRNIWVAFGVLGVIPFIGGLVGGLASLVAVILIAVGINGDTVDRQGWHDRFAGGTRVVKEG
ncbi:RDD family protein [Nocardioides sp. MAHUQ-72]|uniref:RDD family protein n=1 Tax=unclassified Nocardioides TaxID=2615069 RepID=UPI00361B095E